ncbi:hypothetical protein KP509_01G109600 [Ceratopteris richardii]|uniref:Amino acid transporter transmembrane domain-containing protein n=1 Tax=Ceratopteris richardii TaxID=49495 RepID=A0A8T2VP77_CERRI|nr:hypothetical protein KP509_01G109600 [Ceratopteris richardii]
MTRQQSISVEEGIRKDEMLFIASCNQVKYDASYLEVGATNSQYGSLNIGGKCNGLLHKTAHIECKGSSWTRFVVAPLQLGVCFMVVIGGTLLGGQTMKEMYYTYNEEGTVQLSEFIAFFGILVLFLAQIPSMHSLRHFNMVSIMLCFGYSLCAIIGSLVAGLSKEPPRRDYAVLGSEMARTLGSFTAICVMVTSYSNPLVVEIQASLAEPASKKMVKGLSVCYMVALATFVPVAVAGYWAFGNQAEGVILLNLLKPRQFCLVPRWLFFSANGFACVQLVVYTVLHLHPTFERLEVVTIDIKQSKFSRRNLVVRLMSRSFFVVMSTLLAAMLPFFVQFSAFMGAVGFTPICLFLPVLFYNIIFRPSVKTVTFWINYVLMSSAFIVMILGGISALQNIISQATTYRLFANI